MKKILPILFVTFLMISFTGCSGTKAIGSTTSTPASTTLATQALITTTTTIPTTIATTMPEVGTRLNPAPLGSTMIITFDNFSYTAEVRVAITSVLRGDVANKMIMKENQFNEIPEGKETILVKIAADLTSYKPTDENDQFVISDWDFEFFDSSFTVMESESAVIPDELFVEMFEGGHGEGYIHVFALPNEPILIRYGEIAWYSLQ